MLELKTHAERKAALLQGESRLDRAAAALSANESAANEQRKVDMQQQALDLMATSHDLYDLAAADTLAEEAFEEKAKEDMEEALKLEQKAAQDESLYVAYMANATALTATANKTRATAGAASSTGVICKLRIFHKLCDKFGRADQVRAQAAAKASEEDAEATENLVAASAVKENEDSELVRAVELRKKSDAEAAVAVGYGKKAAEEREQADKDEVAAESDEAESSKLLEKIRKEIEDVQVDEERARSEEAQAGVLLDEVANYEHDASWDGLISSILSILALCLFFCFRLWPHLRNLGCRNKLGRLKGKLRAPAMVQKAILWFLHCLAVLSTISTFARKWVMPDAVSSVSHWRFVLVSGCLSSALQSFVVDAMPQVMDLTHCAKGCNDLGSGDLPRKFVTISRKAIKSTLFSAGVSFVAGFSVLLPRHIMEMQILWMSFGTRLFASGVIMRLPASLIWVLFIFGGCCRILISGIKFPTDHKSNNQHHRDNALDPEAPRDDAFPEPLAEGTYLHDHENNVEENIPSETDALLGPDQKAQYELIDLQERVSQDSSSCEIDISLMASHFSPHENVQNDVGVPSTESTSCSAEKKVVQYFSDLQLPFELFVASCMLLNLWAFVSRGSLFFVSCICISVIVPLLMCVASRGKHKMANAIPSSAD